MSKQLLQGDALLIIDVQKDFLPDGSLAVLGGDMVVAPLNAWITRFSAERLPIFATRDWHTADHCSFCAEGGPWPAHCVANTVGAQFSTALKLPRDTTIISKATSRDKDAYSGFAGTDLYRRLLQSGVRRLFVGGLATDYCVLNTVQDALKMGFSVMLLTSAIRAVDAHPGDGERAVAAMMAAGAVALEG